MTLLARWWTQDDGQDLVEYALLGVTVAFAGLVVMNTFGNVINVVYTGWETATQNLWYPQAPAS